MAEGAADRERIGGRQVYIQCYDDRPGVNSASAQRRR